MDASITANTVSVSSSVDAITSNNNPQLPSFIIEGFEKLDKWKECLLASAPKRMVFEQIGNVQQIMDFHQVSKSVLLNRTV